MLAEAESHYRQALSERPTAQTHNGLGYVLARQGQAEAAIAEFHKAIEVDPTFMPAYNNLADTLAREGKLKKAADDYRRALAEQPSAVAHNALGAILRKLGKMDEAADQFSKAKALGSGR